MVLPDFQSGNQYKIYSRYSKNIDILTYLTQNEKFDDYDTEYPEKTVKGKVVKWRYEKTRYYWTQLVFCDNSNQLHFFSKQEIVRAEPYFNGGI